MLKLPPNRATKNTSNNILLSLEYLKEEAKRENNFSLYKILDTAYILGRETEIIKTCHDKDQSQDDDLVHAALLILKFLKSSPEAKENFLRVIKSRET